MGMAGLLMAIFGDNLPYQVSSGLRVSNPIIPTRAMSSQEQKLSICFLLYKSLFSNVFILFCYHESHQKAGAPVPQSLLFSLSSLIAPSISLCHTHITCKLLHILNFIIQCIFHFSSPSNIYVFSLDKVEAPQGKKPQPLSQEAGVILSRHNLVTLFHEQQLC